MLPPGEHTFHYLVDKWEWMADFAAHGVEVNGFGQWVGRLWIDPEIQPVTRPALVEPRLDKEQELRPSDKDDPDYADPGTAVATTTRSRTSVAA